MKIKIATLLILSIFSLVSCLKMPDANEGNSNNDPVPSFDFKVPAGFDWEVHKSVNVSVNIADQYGSRFDYGVEIYNGDKLLERGFIKGNETFTTIVSVENTCTSLTVVQLDPNGDRATEGVAINGNSVILDFAAARDSFTKLGQKGNRANVTVPDNAIEIPASGVLEKDGVYFTKKYVTNVFNVTDVTLYIVGGGIFQIVSETKFENADVYVCPGGRLVGVTPKDDFENVNLFNYGEVNIYGDLSFDEGSLINHSEIFVYNLELSDARLEIYGLLMVGTREPSDAFDNTDFEDFGSIEFDDSLVIIGENALLRAVSLESEDSEITLGTKSWIWVDEDFDIEETTIKNSGEYAVILANELEYDKKSDFEGAIVLDTEIEIEETGGKWDEDIEIGNPGDDVVSIPASYYPILQYNDGGYNAKDPAEIPKPEIIEYFEPSYTIVMEDSYPATGDMDMNDIVCEWQLGTLKDDDNKVTKLGIRYTVKALGGTRHIAAAVALDGIEHSSIKSVKLSKQHSFGKYFDITPIGVESDNRNVVIPLFEDAHTTCFGKEEVIINTFNITDDFYNFDVEIEFTTPIEQSQITRDNINFFIVTNGDTNSRTEIHLYGNSTTAKASNSGATFNNNNIVWGVELMGDFAYPKETISINKSYPEFGAWVQSGGVESEDWYNNPDDNKVLKSSK